MSLLPTARRSDPWTSRAAAAQIGSGVEQAVMRVFRAAKKVGFTDVGLTDDELCQVLSDLYAPTVKSARSRLKNAGLLADSKQTRKSLRGRDSVVWVIA